MTHASYSVSQTFCSRGQLCNIATPKMHTSEEEKHYTCGQSYHNIFNVFYKIMIEGEDIMKRSNLPAFC
jgi:hypothetical protein